MTKERKNELDKNMDEVIKTSKQIRDFMLDENISLEDRQASIKVYITALEANKNIVASSNVQLNTERLFND